MFNENRKFDENQTSKLGCYVYVLRDPRDGKIFYVGKGGANKRVFDHFVEADKVKKNDGPWNSKLRRIVEIWEADFDVDWYIVRYNLESDDVAFDVEAGIIDALAISQNGVSLNLQSGHHTNSKGILSEDEILSLAATPVSPNEAYDTVFIFPSQNAIARGENIYEATRKWWKVSDKLKITENCFAVGIANGISKGVFLIGSWTTDSESGKSCFTGRTTEEHEFYNKSWLAITREAGYWQYGRYLVVQFNSKHQFRFIHGKADKDKWYSL